MSYYRVNENCDGCLACVQNCPATALDYKDEGDKRTILHNMARCARCATCWRVCPQEAVQFEYILENQWDEVVSLELVRCEVCSEPVRTARFGKGLEPGVLEIATPLCPAHKARRQILAGKAKGRRQ